MDAANVSELSNTLRGEPRAVSKLSDRMESPSGRSGCGAVLAEEIDRLRQIMAETFIRESSFTADPVVRVSRQLDIKINEYMRQSVVGRLRAR